MESACIFWGLFSLDVALRGIHREGSPISTIAYLVRAGTAQKSS